MVMLRRFLGPVAARGFVGAAVAVGWALVAPTAALAATLEITVRVAEPREGDVHIGVYDNPEGFPERDTALVGKVLEVTGERVSASFPGLEAGRYAVAAFQDLDQDGELATNLLGIPQEPAAFSRGAVGTMGPPAFEAAAVPVEEPGTVIQVDLGE